MYEIYLEFKRTIDGDTIDITIPVYRTKQRHLLECSMKCHELEYAFDLRNNEGDLPAPKIVLRDVENDTIIPWWNQI